MQVSSNLAPPLQQTARTTRPAYSIPTGIPKGLLSLSPPTLPSTRPSMDRKLKRTLFSGQRVAGSKPWPPAPVDLSPGQRAQGPTQTHGPALRGSHASPDQAAAWTPDAPPLPLPLATGRESAPGACNQRHGPQPQPLCAGPWALRTHRERTTLPCRQDAQNTCSTGQMPSVEAHCHAGRTRRTRAAQGRCQA